VSDHDSRRPYQGARGGGSVVPLCSDDDRLSSELHLWGAVVDPLCSDHLWGDVSGMDDGGGGSDDAGRDRVSAARSRSRFRLIVAPQRIGDRGDEDERADHDPGDHATIGGRGRGRRRGPIG
jgi:hypothetical protein